LSVARLRPPLSVARLRPPLSVARLRPPLSIVRLRPPLSAPARIRRLSRALQRQPSTDQAAAAA
jgi:hypothetical protein